MNCKVAVREIYYDRQSADLHLTWIDDDFATAVDPVHIRLALASGRDAACLFRSKEQTNPFLGLEMAEALINDQCPRGYFVHAITSFESETGGFLTAQIAKRGNQTFVKILPRPIYFTGSWK